MEFLGFLPSVGLGEASAHVTVVIATLRNGMAGALHQSRRLRPSTQWSGNPSPQLDPVLSRRGQFSSSLLTTDFKCDVRGAGKPEGVRASGREVYYSTAHERATIIYPDNDRPAVAVICDANLRAESKRSMCGG